MNNLVSFSLIISLVTILAFATLTFAADFSGQVVSILDGDTIEALHNGESKHLRLNGESNGMGV